MALDGICQRIDGIFRGMPSKSQIILDDTDCLIVAELQRDGRQSVAELGRVISMSASATADRLRRLTDHGVLTGYVATVSAEALGYDIAAFVRLAYPSGNYKPLHEVIDTTPEVIEAHHTTGDDVSSSKSLPATCVTSNESPANWPPWAASQPASSTRARCRAGRSLRPGR